LRTIDKIAKNNTRAPLEMISTLWPKCEACGDHMNFLASVDLSNWIIPIHYMTANNPTHTDIGTKLNKSNFKSYQHSGLGNSGETCMDTEFGLSIRPIYNIFYCDKFHFDTPSFDSILYVEGRHRNSDDNILDVKTYTELISEFVKSNKIKSSVPIQNLEGLTLKFDLDIPGKEFVDDWIYDIMNKYPKIFGSNSSYQFFGRPKSQQTELRYACQNTYSGLEGFHRMAPIVNWTDQSQDVTNQIYGCLRCKETEGRRTVHCKTDKSCT